MFYTYKKTIYTTTQGGGDKKSKTSKPTGITFGMNNLFQKMEDLFSKMGEMFQEIEDVDISNIDIDTNDGDVSIKVSDGRVEIKGDVKQIFINGKEIKL